MNAETELLKSVIKEIVLENHKSVILEILQSRKINWQRLKDLILYHELGNFLYLILKDKENLLPEDFSIFLKDTFYSGFFRYMLLWDEFLKINKEAKRQNILILAIKGLSFTEELYKRYGFRPIVDIDLLIKEEQLDRGIRLLEDLGYKKHLLGGEESYWRTQQCHLEFIRFQDRIPFLAELHWALDFKRGKIEVIPSLWKRLSNVCIENERFYTLSPEDLLFSLALHQRRFGKMFNLKYVCDVGLTLKNHKIDWNYVWQTSQSERMQTSLFFLLYQTDFILDIGLKPYLKALKIPSLQKRLISSVVRKYIYSTYKEFNLNYLYLLCHLLLYDSFYEPLKYIFNIPEEQFAKFYKLSLYSSRTKRLYHLRYLYLPYRLIKDLLSSSQNQKRRAVVMPFPNKP